VSQSSRVQYIASRCTSFIHNMKHRNPQKLSVNSSFWIINNLVLSIANLKMNELTIIAIVVAKYIASAINWLLGRPIVLRYTTMSTWSVNWSRGSTASAIKGLYKPVIVYHCRLKGEFLSCCHPCAPFPVCLYMRISCASEKTTESSTSTYI